MCGIAGILGLDGAPVDAGALERMIGMLRHRGPDGAGMHVQGEVGLAHVRLAIIDVAGGAQPMHSRDGALTLVFNGEIFNYLELREQLERQGHRFGTRSDTEVILHAYEQSGEACVHGFNGQWAFALWDGRRRRLFASRDRLGVRPLYWARLGHRLLFASEIKAILACPGVARDLDLRALDQVLTIWSVASPRTLFASVAELPPGHSMLVDRSEVRVSRYWQLDLSSPDERMSEREAAGRLAECLTDAARIRLRSDVPVGAYLSGGLDSSVITSLVKRLAPGPLKTFSVGFADARYDERAHQSETIRGLEVDHAEIVCGAADIGAVFPEVVWHAEQPMVRTASAPLFLLSRLVRGHAFKVVLTGEGADEMLGGYDLFKEAKIRRFWAKQPGSRMRSRLLRRLYPYMPALQAQPDDYLRAFFHVRPADRTSPFFSHLPRWELTARVKLFYSSRVKGELDGYSAIEEIRGQLPAGFDAWDPFCQAQYLEARYLLPGYLLSSQGDRVAMAHGVEARYPFLDHRVVELASRIPPTLKMKVLDEKHVLKSAAAPLVPASVRSRPKQPYRAPDVTPFYDTERARARFSYVDELLSDSSLRRAGLFRPEAVRLLDRKAREGRIVGAKDGMALVAILSAQLAVEQFVERLGRSYHHVGP
jgi:asparagine synthase (glutamine-hydrolysing)